MGVISAQMFPGNFGGGIRTQRLGESEIFRKWNLFREAVNRRAGGEQKPADPVLVSFCEQIVGAGDIGVDVKLRILE